MRRILVIDDDPGFAKLADSVLRTQNYEVTVSRDAPQGLEMAIKQPPDLIILDVMMPIINGYNICRLLKSQAHLKNIPVILLTSRASEEDRRIGEEAGANAYLSKPLNTEELFQKVKDLLN